MALRGGERLTLLLSNLVNIAQNIPNLLPIHHLIRTSENPLPPSLSIRIRLANDIHHLRLHLLLRSVKPRLRLFPQGTGLHERGESVLAVPDAVDAVDVFLSAEEEGGHEHFFGDGDFGGGRGGGDVGGGGFLGFGEEGDVEVTGFVSWEPGLNRGCLSCTSENKRMLSYRHWGGRASK